MSQILQLRDEVKAYNCANNFPTDYKLEKRSTIHDRVTRNNLSKLRIPLYRSATGGQRTFAYQAVSLWNPLNNDLKHSPSVQFFKTFTENHFKRNTFVAIQYYYCS